MEKNKKLLIVASRAVDIPLFFGGTITKQTKNNWKIVAIITTSVSRNLEKHELAAAGKILGLAHVYFLKYKAGGLKQTGIDNPKMDVYEILQEEKPDIILTIARHGFSTNPDATTTSLATTLAYEKYCKLHTPNFSIPPSTTTSSPTVIPASPEQSRGAKAGIQFPIPKFYFFCFPQQFLSFIQTKGFLRKDPDGYNFEGTPDKKITHVIDVKNFVKQKIEALRIHKSMTTETSRMIELLKTYKSSHMDYYVKYPFEEADRILNRL